MFCQVQHGISFGCKTTQYTIRVALAVNGVFSYLATNGLGSISVALTSSGSAQASALYYPYGGGRYTNGTMPGSYGFTGQQADSTTELDYYGARYYDPLAGQFVSADTVLPGGGFNPWGLSRYAYVEDNPIARIDPTGHRACADPESCRTGKGDDGSTGGDTGGGSPCSESNLCDSILHYFHNPVLISVFYLLLLSDFGKKVVMFLIDFAAHKEILARQHGGNFNPDDLVKFDQGGDFDVNDGTTIHLRPDEDPERLAGSLTPEAMEVYLRQADGINAGSMQMDYIADYMAGQVMEEIESATNRYEDPLPRAYLDKNYGEWINDDNGGKQYSKGFFGIGGPGENSTPDTTVGPFGLGPEKGDNNFLGNPMGLSLDMLRWESNNPNGSGLYGHGS